MISKRTQKIIDFYAHDYRDMEQSEADMKDMFEGFVESLECDHECSSNCPKEVLNR